MKCKLLRVLGAMLAVGSVMIAAGCGADSEKSANGSVTLQVAKLDEILAKIAEQKGKYVIVDTWATWCPPCVAEFPELVLIHEHLGNQGVVCMSVSIDKVAQKEKALAFLEKKRADFPNFLAANSESWLNHWQIDGIPMVLLFGPDGKLIRRFDRDGPGAPFTYPEVEEYVRGLLRKEG